MKERTTSQNLPAHYERRREDLPPSLRNHADLLHTKLEKALSNSGVFSFSDLAQQVRQGTVSLDDAETINTLSQRLRVFVESQTSIEETYRIIEKEAWKDVLGKEIDIPRLPTYLTP